MEYDASMAPVIEARILRRTTFNGSLAAGAAGVLPLNVRVTQRASPTADAASGLDQRLASLCQCVSKPYDDNAQWPCMRAC